ncbi:hypothetical protein K1719_017005 [Acacia pycnantha]|nr:hypothetical protein K1719_017005 [Acacia pycnantha]
MSASGNASRSNSGNIDIALSAACFRALPNVTLVVGEIINNHQLEIVTLANLSSLTVINENDAVPSGCAVSVVNENLSVYIELQGSISAEAELGKIKKKIDEFKKQKGRLEKTINASGYREKVPSHIQQDNNAKLASLLQELLSLEEATGQMESQARHLASQLPKQNAMIADEDSNYM